MKKIFLLAIFLSFSFFSFANKPPKNSNSDYIIYPTLSFGFYSIKPEFIPLADYFLPFAKADYSDLYTPNFGFYVEVRNYAIKTLKLNFISGFNYYFVKFYGIYHRQDNIVDSLVFRYHTFEIPINFKLDFWLTKNFHIFALAGFNNKFNLFKDFHHFYYFNDQYVDKYQLDLNFFNFGLTYGLGLRYKRLALAFNYEITSNYFKIRALRFLNKIYAVKLYFYLNNII